MTIYPIGAIERLLGARAEAAEAREAALHEMLVDNNVADGNVVWPDA